MQNVMNIVSAPLFPGIRGVLLSTLTVAVLCAFPVSSMAQEPLSHGTRPSGFDSVQEPTERPAALLDGLEVTYPESAHKQRLEGVSIIAAWIDRQGYVPYAEVHESSGHRFLDSIALRAVVRGDFRAAQRNGRTVGSRVTIPVEFRLQRDEDQYDAVKSEEQLRQEAEELRRARQMIEEERIRLEEEIRRLKQRQKSDTLHQDQDSSTKQSGEFIR